MSWKIPLSDIDFNSEEKEAVLRVIGSRWLSMGEETSLFEQEFAEYIGVRHALAVANGTAAIHLAMLALEIGPREAIIQPAVNFVACANMTVAVGAVPVFADICSLDEPIISLESVQNILPVLENQPDCQPKAMIVMHYGGYTSRIDEIKALCDEHGMALIEDACHGVGGSYKNINLGAWGDVACFSFFSNKNMVTGEGGMITTNRDDIAEKLRVLRSHGMTSMTWDRHRGHAATYDVTAHGYNYRIDEIRSAIGRVQLKKLDNNNQLRTEITALYQDKLKTLEALGWILPFRQASANKSMLPSAHLFPLVAPDSDTRWKCADALKSAGIQTSLHYPFLLAFSAFAHTESHTALDKSQDFCKRVITLPLYPTMTEEDVKYVADQVLASAGRN